MMEYPERLPVTLGNQQFPIGDITEPLKIEQVDSWIEDVSDYDFGRLSNYIQYSSKPNGMDNAAVSDNHRAALDLCRRWDMAQGDKRKFAVTGFVVARAFQNATKLLPNLVSDITPEIDRMRREQFDNARSFGKAAWAGMELSHPSVFAQHEKLLRLSEEKFDLQPDKNKDYFLAGMTLPYMLASVIRLEGYMKRNPVTGMKVGTIEELESMEFRRIFTNNL